MIFDIVDLAGDRLESSAERIERLAYTIGTIEVLLREALHVHDGQLTEAPAAAVRRFIQTALDVAEGNTR
jgi:hypothetical protein